MKKRVNSVFVEKVLGISIPNMDFEAVPSSAVEGGMPLIVVGDGIAIAVTGAMVSRCSGMDKWL